MECTKHYIEDCEDCKAKDEHKHCRCYPLAHCRCGRRDWVVHQYGR